MVRVLSEIRVENAACRKTQCQNGKDNIPNCTSTIFGRRLCERDAKQNKESEKITDGPLFKF